MELKRRAPGGGRGAAFLFGVAVGVFGTHFWLAFEEDAPPTKVTFEPVIEIYREPPNVIEGEYYEPLPERVPVARKLTPDELRDQVDRAFVDRRRAGFIMWDDMTTREQDAVQGVLSTYRIMHDLPLEGAAPNMVGLHPRDRHMLDRFATNIEEQTRHYMQLDEAVGPILVEARLGKKPPHYQLMTVVVGAKDPRLINGEEAFLARWAYDHKRPGWWELATHHRDAKSGDVTIDVHWLDPDAHPLLAKHAQRMTELRSEGRELAAILFPRLYHEVK